MQPCYSAINFFYNLLALKRNLRRKKSELIELQEKKLRAIVKHAYEAVPFYHKLFKTYKIAPGTVRTTDDLRKLPMITKKEVQENFEAMVSKKANVSNCIKQKPLDLQVCH